MNHRFKFFTVVLFLFSIGASAQTSGCDPKLWNHVYNTDWLHVKRLCFSATGTVYTAGFQADGSYRIRLLLDAGQETLINNKNINDQYGCLVVDIICSGTVTYPDAVGPCDDFRNEVTLPKRGDHIKATGSYVLNFQYGWYELCPVSAIKVLP